MTITVELPDDIAIGMNRLPEKDKTLFYEGVRRYATSEAQRLATMTEDERREYEESCAAIAESLEQIKRGEYITLDEAMERTRQEIEAERAQGAGVS